MRWRGEASTYDIWYSHHTISEKRKKGELLNERRVPRNYAASLVVKTYLWTTPSVNCRALERWSIICDIWYSHHKISYNIGKKKERWTIIKEWRVHSNYLASVNCRSSENQSSRTLKFQYGNNKRGDYFRASIRAKCERNGNGSRVLTLSWLGRQEPRILLFRN